MIWPSMIPFQLVKKSVFLSKCDSHSKKSALAICKPPEMHYYRDYMHKLEKFN